MLKGLDPRLGPDLLHALRAMGHGDDIAIVDGNYPAEAHAKRLVRMDGHSGPAIAEAILSVMPLDDAVEMPAIRPAAFGDSNRVEPVMQEYADVITRYEPWAKLTPLAGEAFYDRVRAAFVIIASSEPRLYGNLVLKKGVIRQQNETGR